MGKKPFAGKILNLFENAPFITYSILLNSNYGQSVLEIKLFFIVPMGRTKAVLDTLIFFFLFWKVLNHILKFKAYHKPNLNVYSQHCLGLYTSYFGMLLSLKPFKLISMIRILECSPECVSLDIKIQFRDWVSAVAFKPSFREIHTTWFTQNTHMKTGLLTRNCRREMFVSRKLYLSLWYFPNTRMNNT